jgi:hypothetical protein
VTGPFVGLDVGSIVGSVETYDGNGVGNGVGVVSCVGPEVSLEGVGGLDTSIGCNEGEALMEGIRVGKGADTVAPSSLTTEASALLLLFRLTGTAIPAATPATTMAVATTATTAHGRLILDPPEEAEAAAGVSGELAMVESS